MLAGPQVLAAHQRLLARAVALGWHLETEAGLTITAERGGLQVTPLAPERVRIAVPAGTRWLRLASRSFVPEALDPGCGDGRRLGVALAVELQEGMALPAAAFVRGWYAAEEGAAWRWTNGEAVLALPADERDLVLTLHLVPAGGRYWAPPARTAQAAA